MRGGMEHLTNAEEQHGSAMNEENAEKISDPVWNQADLLLRVDNDQELMRELLEIFGEDFPRTMRSLESAVSAGDLKNSASLSHALKGMLSNLGGVRAAAAAARLEKSASSGGEASLLREAFDDLQREAGRLLPELQAFLLEVGR